MSVLKYFIVLCAIFGLFDLAYSVELTFELPDSAKQCFFQEIEEGVESTIEFQVKKLISKEWPCLKNKYLGDNHS